MEHVSLAASSRTVVGKQVRALRREGLIPGNVYGHKLDNLNISLNARDFDKLFTHTGTTTLIDLKIDGKKATPVLVHEVQRNSPRREIIHADLFAVNLKEKLRTAVPLTFTGTSEAVELLGGILQTPKDEVEVECLPEDLVQELTLDLGVLKTFDDHIKVSDIVLPSGIVILDEADEVIAVVNAQAAEEELDLDSPVVDDAAAVESETKSGTEAPPAEEEK